MYQLNVTCKEDDFNGRGCGNRIFYRFWINFLKNLADIYGDIDSVTSENLNQELALFDAINPGGNKEYIEFDNEEDAILFKLKWS